LKPFEQEENLKSSMKNIQAYLCLNFFWVMSWVDGGQESLGLILAEVNTAIASGPLFFRYALGPLLWEFRTYSMFFIVLLKKFWTTLERHLISS